MALKIRSCAPGVSLFQLVDSVWDGPTGNETLHRICTMMRWMSARSVVIENVDKSFQQHEQIFQEIDAITKRLSCKILYEIYKLTFLHLLIDDSETIEAKTSKVTSAANGEFLGYAIVVNLTFRERFKKSYIFEAIIRDLSSSRNDWDNAVL